MTEEAMAYIREHYARIHSVTEIAERLGISYHVLRKAFPRDTGKSLAGYLHQTRVEQARFLKSSTSLKLYAIAREVGYVNDHVLRKHWKKILGTKPSEHIDLQ